MLPKQLVHAILCHGVFFNDKSHATVSFNYDFIIKKKIIFFGLNMIFFFQTFAIKLLKWQTI